MNIKYQIIAGIVVLVTCSFILMKVTNNNEPELELTAEQQQCEHEWKCGETCVEESKYHIESSDAMDKIKDYLKSVDFKFYDETVLKETLNNKAKIKI